MIAQTVLPFKLEITKDEITPHAGPAPFGEFVHAMGLPLLINRELPAPAGGAGRPARPPRGAGLSRRWVPP